MTDAQPANQDQRTLWNGAAGQAWVDAQPVLDRMFEGFEGVLLDPVRAGDRVLDVGCGTGALAIAAARKAGSSMGLDISEPMIAAARERAAHENASASFICADAQTYDFESGAVDAIISRFGVMFFDDPIAAFANLRRATRKGGLLRFAAWRSPAENSFMTTAERAAAPLLPAMPPRQPNAPGQFAFADAPKVEHILRDAGWRDIAIQPIDIGCRFPEPDLLRYLSRLGPLGLALAQLDEPSRARILETVRAAFAPYIEDAEVRYTAACWLASASA